jgi:hypothetical protein
MLVEDIEQPATSSFKSVTPGECFRHNGSICLKLQPQQSQSGSAVELVTGKLVAVTDPTIVGRVDARLKVSKYVQPVYSSNDCK